MSIEPLLQDKGSIQLLQALQADLPCVELLYKAIGIEIPHNNSFNYSHITSRFYNPSAIIVVGALTTCFIIQRSAYREYDVISIESNTSYRRLKSSDLQSIIYKKLCSNECIQSPLYKKLVFITQISEMCGIIAYCKSENQLIVDGEPLDMNEDYKVINCKKTIMKFLETRER